MDLTKLSKIVSRLMLRLIWDINRIRAQVFKHGRRQIHRARIGFFRVAVNVRTTVNRVIRSHSFSEIVTYLDNSFEYHISCIHVNYSIYARSRKRAHTHWFQTSFWWKSINWKTVLSKCWIKTNFNRLVRKRCKSLQLLSFLRVSSYAFSAFQ